MNYNSSSTKSIYGNSSGLVHNDKPASPYIKCFPDRDEDSIINTIDTGFGSANYLSRDCRKFKTHLFKEDYLGDFKSETEKTLVRNNLDVYSRNETHLIVSSIIAENNLISKDDIEETLENLDFVNSTLRANVKYDIPDNLFKL